MTSLSHLPNTLADWLAYCERLHPKNIDMGLERVRAVAQRLNEGRGLQPACAVITVAGTNGKGSTCAMLEAIYQQAGYRTGVYTSPHMVHFEERCRIQGDIVKADELLPAFADVELARRGNGADQADIGLTYFEFTTLAIVLTLARSSLDVMILEVGLGGRLDAVNVLDADCAVITSIDLDHVEYLGPDRETIGYEKAGIMRTGRPVVVSDPVPPQSVLDRALEIGADLYRAGRDFHCGGDKQQWNWAGRSRRYAGMAYPALRGANQLVNAAGVLAVVEALHPRLPVTAQAVRNGLALVELPGRFQIIPGQPPLVLDVAHNPHSVAALTENLDAMGFYPATHAVFGAMADKDLRPMFERVGPLIDRWYFCDLPTERAAKAQDLAAIWQGVNTRQDVKASQYPNPQAALDAAVAAADPADRIVVFGSFYTVGGVLQNGTPKLAAKHLQS
jgi:dihydrofolate synthase / folylpolyglutamate synthase